MVKFGIERKARLRGCPRLVERAEQRQGSGELEMREREIAVGLDAPAKPERPLLRRRRAVTWRARQTCIHR